MNDPVERAVCVGFVDLDVIHRVEGPPVWGRKSVCTSVELAAGGPAANAAVSAAALLGSARLISAVGSGAAADLVRADLAAHGVELVDCAPPGWVLPVASALVGPDGARTVVSPSGQWSSWSLTPAARQAVAQADGLLLDGHHPVAARQALDARPPGCVAVLDAGSVKPHAESWLADLDVVAGSADYAAGLGVDLVGAVRHVLDAGAPAAVMTNGAAPVVWATQADPTPRRHTPPQVTAVDTLGAGDAFHGALLAGLLTAGRLPHGRAPGEHAVGGPETRGSWRAGLPAAVELACAVAATRVATVGARACLEQPVMLGEGAGSGGRAGGDGQVGPALLAWAGLRA